MRDNHDYSEDYDDIEEPETRSVLRFAPLFAVIAAVAGVGALAWFSYKSGTTETVSSGDNIPLIKAEEGSIREKPLDPGGMEIPNQDKEIYDAVAGKTARSSSQETEEVAVVQEDEIIPVTETQAKNQDPQPKQEQETVAITQNTVTPTQSVTPSPQVAEAPVAAQKTIENVQQKPSETKVEKIISSPQPKQEVAKIEAKTETKTAVKKIESEVKPSAEANNNKPSPSKLDNTSKTSSASSTGDSKVRVQLAAFKTEKEALETWDKIFAKNKDILSNKTFTVKKADVPGKGVFYRLQVGSFNNRDEAGKFCSTLTVRNQACFIAR